MKDREKYIKIWEPALKGAGVQHPRADLERILVVAGEGPPGAARAEQMARRRQGREPLERILNRFTFYGLEMELQDGVFKPGFETETTVEHGLHFLKNLGRSARILDLGTGSGCVLITLLHHLPDATGVGIDRDEPTLDLARRNAVAHKVTDRVEFRITDWTSGIGEKFDLIISNPPRIPTQAIKDLVREVRIFDPHEALDGGRDGSDFYARTAFDARRILSPDGTCILQVGNIVAAQAIKSIWREGFSNARFLRDYKGAFNCVRFDYEAERPKPLRDLAGGIGHWVSSLSSLFFKKL